MQVFRVQWFLLLTVILAGCTKTTKEKVIYNNVIYQVDDVTLYTSSAEKTKQKSQAQYISILYADLFNKSISNQELNELEELSLAIGDKTMANELIISHYLVQSNAVVPSNANMRADLDSFIDQTYVRFYQRPPTGYEKHFLKNLIENDPSLSPVSIYTSFMLSNEYYFY